VDKKLRGKGIGTQLIKETLRIMKEKWPNKKNKNISPSPPIQLL